MTEISKQEIMNVALHRHFSNHFMGVTVDTLVFEQIKNIGRIINAFLTPYEPDGSIDKFFIYGCSILEIDFIIDIGAEKFKDSLFKKYLEDEKEFIILVVGQDKEEKYYIDDSYF